MARRMVLTVDKTAGSVQIMSGNDETKEPQIHGIPQRLFDGYDGGPDISPEQLAALLENAPPEIRARAEQFARERQAASVQSDEQPID